MTDVISGFPPVADKTAKILILGSMPGVDSLKMNQYYAHPRNAFWRIMAALFDFAYDDEYRYRLERLKENRIALWDVVGECIRPGSLDSRIKHESVVTNDFESFFMQHAAIRKICFNGATAEKLFLSRVARVLPGSQLRGIEMTRLPSTSPAMASLSFDKKLDIWASALIVEP